jgi:hypothetical protein
MKKVIYLSSGRFEYENLPELKDEFEKLNIKLGNGCKLGYGCELGDWCELGYRCELGDGCKLNTTPFYSIGLYKYHVSAYYNNSIPYIQLGCYLRTLKEWEADFWNNPSEFTDPDAPESKKRLFAFNIAKQWLENNKPEK